MTEQPDKNTLYRMQYAKEKLKRIPLDVQRSEYDRIKSSADAAGETVNGYIKKAVRQRMDREQPDLSDQ